ncbi:MAG TPA: glycosyltransferase 87 family protein [Vicinamibacteria bacterium]|nr:glycosyltransferase 87 family protein [Vicinamibacteria bacterium]
MSADRWRHAASVAGVAFLLRAAAALLSDRTVADVLRYHKLGAHILDVSWNPYAAARLYPYPPVWVWVEAGAEWLARHAAVPFPLAVKAPVVLADALLAGLIAAWTHGTAGIARGAGWLYAVHPIALLVVGFHGQFDAVALLALVCALGWLREGRLDRSALALSAGIALKSFPVLVLPFALLFVERPRARVRYAALAVLPVLLILAPFAIADPRALVRELFAYGGIPDFGWIGGLRAVRSELIGRVARASAEEWTPLLEASKLLFLVAAAGLWAACAAERRKWRPESCALAVLLAFQVFYGALSAQYLLWPVPFALLLGERFTTLHAGVSSVALVGFYLFLAPGVLTPADLAPWSPAVSQRLWMAGTVGLWLTSVVWLADLVRRERVRT